MKTYAHKMNQDVRTFTGTIVKGTLVNILQDKGERCQIEPECSTNQVFVSRSALTKLPYVRYFGMGQQ